MLNLFSRLSSTVAVSLVCATGVLGNRTLAADANLHIYNTCQLRYAVGGLYFGALSNPTHISAGDAGTRFVDHHERERAAQVSFVRTANRAAQTGTIRLEALKSQDVFDANGDPMLVSGSRILYRIVISGTGAGTATSTVMTDPVPANTTYIANSMRLNGRELTDEPDDDGAQILSGTADIVQVTVGNVSEATGPQVVEFEVLVN
jgi:uncharacterized repeat protein (TIGR01451 family)